MSRKIPEPSAVCTLLPEARGPTQTQRGRLREDPRACSKNRHRNCCCLDKNKGSAPKYFESIRHPRRGTIHTPGNQGQALLWESAPSWRVSVSARPLEPCGSWRVLQVNIKGKFCPDLENNMGEPRGLWFLFPASGWAIWRLPEKQPVRIFHQNISNCQVLW